MFMSLQHRSHPIPIPTSNNTRSLDNTVCYSVEQLNHDLMLPIGMPVQDIRSSSYNSYVSSLTPGVTSSTSTTRTSTSSTRTSTTVIPTGTSCPAAPAPSFALNTAPGYRAAVVLGGLTQPRGITADTRGNLLVVQRTRGITGAWKGL